MADERAQQFIWPCLNYADARAGMRFLVDVLGFEETARLLIQGGRR